MTQEQLAKAIGRSKMTVSQFEKGKNAPPQGELLEKNHFYFESYDRAGE